MSLHAAGDADSLCGAYEEAREGFTASDAVYQQVAGSNAIVARLRHRDRLWRSRETALDNVDHARRRLATSTVGAARSWGVLSGDEHHNVESALLGVRQRLEALGGPRLVAMIRDLKLGASEIRVAVHRGDESARDDFACRIAQLVTLCRIADVNRPDESKLLRCDVGLQIRDSESLEFYVPVSLREHVADIETIVNRNRPVRLEAAWDGDEIYLSGLYIGGAPSGKGAGTAALEDLCNYADRHCVRVRALFGPDEPGKPRFSTLSPAFLDRVARWYERHGFRPADGSGQWLDRETRMVRDPRPT